MTQHQATLELATRGRGFTDLTREVAAVLAASRVRTGLCVVYCPHTSCSLLIQENADPDVRRDLADWLARHVPDGDPAYRHDAEGPDDMPSHIRAMLTRTSESIPVVAGRLAMGTWQALYLVEHRTSSHARRVIVHVSGE